MSSPAAAFTQAKPKFKLPPGACDAHCHVFGPADKFPYAASRRYTPEGSQSKLPMVGKGAQR